MKYTRDPSIANRNLVENSNGEVLTKADCKIQIPVRFATRGLGQVGIDTFSYGLFPVIYGDSYSVINVNALIELNPAKVNIITVDEVEYYEFSFDAGQVVIKTTDLIKRSDIIYSVFDEFIFKGKVPWYVGYEDLGKLFDTSKQYADSIAGQNLEVIELLASMITRDTKDRTKYIRTAIDKYSDTGIEHIDYVPLSSVFYSVNSTVNKLAGSYFSEGVISALVTPTTKSSKIENILRA